MTALETIAEYARQLVREERHSGRMAVAEDFSEWVASQLGEPIDRKLPVMVTNFAESESGEMMLRWSLMAYEKVNEDR